MINFICFVVISVSYIIIGILSTKSSNKVTSRRHDEQALKRNRRMNQRISLIITTDFLCWVPFIIICILHYVEIFDATPWYSVLSMVILPINSVINPLIYNEIIMSRVALVLSRTNTRISGFASTFRSNLSSNQQSLSQEEVEIQVQN